jgi:uncharacterized protein (TIGR00369 family)
MSATVLSQDAARRLIGAIFVYDMPFNRELGLELATFDEQHVELTFTHQTRLVGNAAQQILHGGVIASVLDVAAGLVCVGSALLRHGELTEQVLRERMAKMGTIDLRVDYLRPGRGDQFTASSTLLRAGNKVAVARVELHNEAGQHIASATATYLVG